MCNCLDPFDKKNMWSDVYKEIGVGRRTVMLLVESARNPEVRFTASPRQLFFNPSAHSSRSVGIHWSWLKVPTLARFSVSLLLSFHFVLFNHPRFSDCLTHNDLRQVSIPCCLPSDRALSISLFIGLLFVLFAGAIAIVIASFLFCHCFSFGITLLLMYVFFFNLCV